MYCYNVEVQPHRVCIQSYQWVTSDVWSEDKWPECKDKIVMDVNLCAWRPPVAVHLTHYHRFKRILPGQTPVYTELCGNGKQFCLLMSRYDVEFVDGCVCVWRGWIELFHPKKFIQRNRYDGGSVMIWNKIDYDKNGLVKVNATPNSQPFCEGFVVHGVVLSLILNIREHMLYFLRKN
jgi:hypothetical protein